MHDDLENLKAIINRLVESATKERAAAYSAAREARDLADAVATANWKNARAFARAKKANAKIFGDSLNAADSHFIKMLGEAARAVDPIVGLQRHASAVYSMANQYR